MRRPLIIVCMVWSLFTAEKAVEKKGGMSTYVNGAFTAEKAVEKPHARQQAGAHAFTAEKAVEK